MLAHLNRLAKRTHALGDRITGGGLRSLTKRSVAKLVLWAMRRPALLAVGRIVLKPFPTITAYLCRFATTQTVPAPDSSPTELVPSDTGVELATLTASARPIYRRLKAAMSHGDSMREALELVITCTAPRSKPSLYDLNKDLFANLGRNGPEDLSNNRKHLDDLGE